MRLATLAVLGLVLATGPAFATAQRNGPQAQAPARAAQLAPARPNNALRPVVYRPSAAPAATRRTAQVHRSAPLRGQVGVLRDARAASASTAIGPRRQVAGRGRAVTMRWTQGLPAPANIQANECPDGTMATLARGHDDIVRCMPL